MEAKVEKKMKSSLTMRNLKSLIFNLKSNRGVSLYLALLIMTVLLSIGFGISAILFSQIKIIRGIGDSVVAFYAADTGIEEVLYRGGAVSGNLENGASYSTRVLAPGPDCTATNYCIISKGSFKETKRAIEIER